MTKRQLDKAYAQAKKELEISGKLKGLSEMEQHLLIVEVASAWIISEKIKLPLTSLRKQNEIQ